MAATKYHLVYNEKPWELLVRNGWWINFLFVVIYWCVCVSVCECVQVYIFLYMLCLLLSLLFLLLFSFLFIAEEFLCVFLVEFLFWFFFRYKNHNKTILFLFICLVFALQFFSLEMLVSMRLWLPFRFPIKTEFSIVGISQWTRFSVYDSVYCLWVELHASVWYEWGT